MRPAALALAASLAAAFAAGPASGPAPAQDGVSITAGRTGPQAGGSGPASAGDGAAARARAAIAMLEAASEAHAAARGRADRVAALTDTVRAYEEGLTALRAGLRQTVLQERALAAEFEARSGEISRLLGVLASVERAPGPVLLLHPSGPVDTARAAMVAADLAQALQAEAAEIRARLDALRELREVERAARASLAAALAGAQQARAALSRAIADRASLPPRYAEDPGRLSDLATASESLAAFAEGLAALGTPAAQARPAGTLRAGALPLPVAGTILRRFGEADAAGVARPGLLLATHPEALVTAPFAATVRYTGPFLDYGNVMILEPEAGTLMVLAGLGVLYAPPGSIVTAGDPLALMPGSAGQAPGAPPEGGPAITESGAAADAPRTETLYIELRQGEAPVDPAGWFAIDRQE
jgi:septal ring factor EnvC (AmiA/AmiB activator)